MATPAAASSFPISPAPAVTLDDARYHGKPQAGQPIIDVMQLDQLSDEDLVIRHRAAAVGYELDINELFRRHRDQRR